MDWSSGLGSLRRGLGIASRAAVARLHEYGPAMPGAAPAVPGRFVVARQFGINPGRLRLRAYLPVRAVRPGAPLIVLLHGCGQDAGDFAADTGWTGLADRLRLPLLLPEQQEANHRQRCFHWFHLAETRRGQGEAASIAAMVAAMTARYQCDPRHVFIAGLSAGGAMAAAMLAAYPDVFCAGASFAGLPVGEATSLVQALTHMAHGGGNATPAEWVAMARRIGPPGYTGPWPRLSVWSGAADQVVAPENSTRLAAQWCALHRLPGTPTHRTTHRLAWGDAVELWTLPGLGHAWAIGEHTGRASPYAAPNTIDAVTEITRFWAIG